MSYTFTATKTICEHDPVNVAADILEGDVRGLAVQWCRTCGSYRRVYGDRAAEWRVPEREEIDE
jgi:hypothetical protein